MGALRERQNSMFSYFPDSDQRVSSPRTRALLRDLRLAAYTPSRDQLRLRSSHPLVVLKLIKLTHARREKNWKNNDTFLARGPPFPRGAHEPGAFFLQNGSNKGRVDMCCIIIISNIYCHFVAAISRHYSAA